MIYNIDRENLILSQIEIDIAQKLRNQFVHKSITKLLILQIEAFISNELKNYFNQGIIYERPNFVVEQEFGQINFNIERYRLNGNY